jgi:hypothetical protein
MKIDKTGDRMFAEWAVASGKSIYDLGVKTHLELYAGRSLRTAQVRWKEGSNLTAS